MNTEIENLNIFQSWLDTMTAQTLPGAIAAAAVGAAVGAALVAKATRVTLDRRKTELPQRSDLEEMLELAKAGQRKLMRLARADERAYRQVLDTADLGAGEPARRRALHDATEVPLRVSSTCKSLLDLIPDLMAHDWPAVHADAEVGQWLVEVGFEAGLLVAEENLRVWGDRFDARPLQARLEALRTEEL